MSLMGQIKNKLAIFMFHSPYGYRAIFSQNDSLKNIFVQRALRILNYVFYRVFLNRKTTKKTQGLTKLIQVYKEKKVLLVANGPSVRKINFLELSDLQALNQIAIVGVNYSPLLLVEEYQRSVKLDLLILSDNFMHPRNRNRGNENLWAIVNQMQINIVTPTDWCDPAIFSQCKANNCLHFNDYGTEGMFLHTDPTKTRNYISLTAFKALAICVYLQFSKIYLIGLDNNFFLGMRVDDKLRLIENAHHATELQHFESDVSSYWPAGLGDYFYFISKMFLDLRKYFNLAKVVNLDIDSLNDVHRKVDIEDEFYGLVKSS